jgi:hypothetical protein
LCLRNVNSIDKKELEFKFRNIPFISFEE